MVEGDADPARRGDAGGLRGRRRVQRRAPGERRLGVRRRPAPGRHRHGRATPRGGEVVTTEGPFAETKEQLGGFWVIEAADLDAALAWAAKGVGGLRGAGRGAAVPGRARGLTP